MPTTTETHGRAFRRLRLAFWRTYRAYSARLDLCGVAHDEQLAFLARAMASEARKAGLL